MLLHRGNTLKGMVARVKSGTFSFLLFTRTVSELFDHSYLFHLLPQVELISLRKFLPFSLFLPHLFNISRSFQKHLLVGYAISARLVQVL